MTATHTIQRPLRGSRISTFYPVKNLPSLASLDSAFQLQEYISLLIRLDVHDVDSIVSVPGTSKQDKEREKEGGTDESGRSEVQVDQACWIYEQLRRLAQDLSHPLITTLQQECTRQTCPEMKAGEWLYLCVAHGNDGAMEQCCAIDYILHTVDSATALLNSPRTFPSRLQIPQTSHRHFSSLARRLGRIFAHAYFSHREAFEQAEAESSLYARFLALTAKFDLVPAEFLVIPSSGQENFGGTDEHGREMEQHQTQAQMYGASPGETQQPLLGRSGLAPKNANNQQQLGLGRTRSPNPPGLLNLGPSSSSTGTWSPGPSAGSTTDSNGNGNRGSPLPRGRNRTDTMIFADLEASGVVDELVAKVRAGEFDFTPDESVLPPKIGDESSKEDEHIDHGDETETEAGDGPKTAKPGEKPLGEYADDEEEEADGEEVEDMDLETDISMAGSEAPVTEEASKPAENTGEDREEKVEFEISLDPEEEIPVDGGETETVAPTAAASEEKSSNEEHISETKTEADLPSEVHPADADADELEIELEAEPVDSAEFEIIDDAVVKVELEDEEDDEDEDESESEDGQPSDEKDKVANVDEEPKKPEEPVSKPAEVAEVNPADAKPEESKPKPDEPKAAALAVEEKKVDVEPETKTKVDEVKKEAGQDTPEVKESS
ncbi:Mob1/phocein [Crepidotus variabilis]|uniref:Mob1/phocein n=1 Tax=Crepidotus variabilis TaxID=179855 RepID=A0A9P6E9H3_9AGAR|nr:Mob1/phocein [Crepidotus variabilis]